MCGLSFLFFVGQVKNWKQKWDDYEIRCNQVGESKEMGICMIKIEGKSVEHKD